MAGDILIEHKYERFKGAIVGFFIGVVIVLLRYESYEALLAMREPTLYHILMFGVSIWSMLFELAAMAALLYLYIMWCAGLAYRRKGDMKLRDWILWPHRALMAKVGGD